MENLNKLEIVENEGTFMKVNQNDFGTKLKSTNIKDNHEPV